MINLTNMASTKLFFTQFEEIKGNRPERFLCIVFDQLLKSSRFLLDIRSFGSFYLHGSSGKAIAENQFTDTFLPHLFVTI